MKVEQGARCQYFKLESAEHEGPYGSLLFSSAPKRREENGLLRPWLYGNRWNVPFAESNPNLVGMGVHIARGPRSDKRGSSTR